MQKAAKYALTAALCVLAALYSCRKEPTYWEDDFVAPIAQGKLTLANLFPDTTIKTDPDSSLRIAFDAEVINYGIDSLLKIPDTTITTVSTNTIVPKIAITPGMTILTNTSSTYYDFPNGIKLATATIKFGKVKVELVNTARQPLSYHYKLLSAFKNTVMLDTVFEIPKATYSGTVCTSQGTLSTFLNLAGYLIDFTGVNKNVTNTVDQWGQVSVSTNAQPDTLYINQGLISTFTFTGIVPQYAQGYFGNQSVSVGPDTTDFTVFSNMQSGLLNLNSADVKLRLINEFGVAMKASIGNLTALSTANAASTVLTSTVVGNSFTLNGAVNNGSSLPVTAGTKTITLNNSNSNIKDLIGILPDKFIYQVNTQLNPNGNLGGNNDFAYYGTGFKAYLNADIPLQFSASNLVLIDTTDINFTTVSQLDNVNHGQLLLTATNSYPFSIQLQGYLLDENRNVLEPLFGTPNTIQQPPLDANFKVIAPLNSTLSVPLTAGKIVNLKKARYIKYLATFNTAAQPNPVKFYSHYTLDILLTADINYTIGK
jgi:hypothetical protein